MLLFIDNALKKPDLVTAVHLLQYASSYPIFKLYSVLFNFYQ